MKSLLIKSLLVVSIMMAISFPKVSKIETTATGTLITFEDGTDYYMEKEITK